MSALIGPIGNIDGRILESMDDWVRIVAVDGTILFANRAMREALEEDPVGQPVRTFDARHGIPRYNFTSVVQNKKSLVTEEEIRGRYYSIKSSPIFDQPDHLTALVDVFRDITTESAIRTELFNANRRMLDEIRLAKSIQEKILPDKGAYGNILVDYRYVPSGTLSGDMFDICPIDKNHIGVYMSDVVGHGVAASIMTMFIRQTMRSIVLHHPEKNPNDVFNELYQRFIELGLPYEYYFTMFFATINTETGHFTFGNAGHNCPPIFMAKDRYHFIEISGRPITRIRKEKPYNMASIQLKAGDRLIFYTDGILETKDMTRAIFGMDRLLDIIKGAQNPLDALVTAVNNYRWGEQEDDIALMELRVDQAFKYGG